MAQAFHQAQWDEAGSTWIQLIYFKNGKLMQGYSKRVNFDEKGNKISLLTNWILRMFKAGYLDRTNQDKTEIEYIEYFRNHIEPELVLRLYYDTYEIHCPDLQNNVSLRKFLRTFYQYIEIGKTSDYIYTKLYDSKPVPFQNPLDLTKHRFIEPGLLFKYCRTLILDKKASVEETKAFYVQYLSKFFNQSALFADKSSVHDWISKSEDFKHIQ